MDPTSGMSVREWLSTESEENIAEVIRRYGEERFAVQIAKEIVACRAKGAIHSTRQLAEIVARAVKTREKGKDPATRTFQSFRLYVNGELEELEIALDQAWERLAVDGRMAIISFHSLEDRIVKQFMVGHSQVEKPDRRVPVRDCDLPKPMMKILARIKPSEKEVVANPRARSAILRVAKRIATEGGVQ